MLRIVHRQLTNCLPDTYLLLRILQLLLRILHLASFQLGLKVVWNPRPFDPELSDLSTLPSMPPTGEVWSWYHLYSEFRNQNSYLTRSRTAVLWMWFRTHDLSIQSWVTYPLCHPCRRQERFEVDIIFIQSLEIKILPNQESNSRPNVVSPSLSPLSHPSFLEEKGITSVSFLPNIINLRNEKVLSYEKLSYGPNI